MLHTQLRKTRQSATHKIGQRTSRPWHVGLAVCLAIVPCFCLNTTARAQNLDTDTIKKVKKSAVLIFTAASKRGKGDTPLGSGSGFFVNSTGLAVSNNHVVDPTHGKSDREKFKAHYQGGKLTWSIITNSGTDDEQTYEAVVIYQNEKADQAVLQTFDEDGEKLSTPNYLSLLPESRLHERMKVWAFGFPGGDQQGGGRGDHPEVTITKGNVLEAPRTPGGRIRMIYTDVIARPGNSGGAMVTADGFLVGTVTLMKKPEGREDTGGANYSALVPATITNQMVQYAFELGKIPAGTDVTPFMSSLPRVDGRINIPEYARLENRDVLFFEDGDRIYGQIEDKSVTWESELGIIEVPSDAIAYIMNNSMGSHLFLEGGNRIDTLDADSKFKFVPVGGESAEHDIESIAVLGFRTSDHGLRPVTGRSIILETDSAYLVLTDVAGETSFEGRIGKINVALTDIVRLERHENGKQILTLRDGRRMTGKFGDGSYQGTIAATQTPIEFNFRESKWANIEMRNGSSSAVAGLGISGILSDADPDVQRTSSKLQKGDVSGARTAIDKALESSSFRRMPQSKKDQLRLLNAACHLRAAEYDLASKAFRKCKNANNENIKAYAVAASEVLKRAKKHAQNESPLSDPDVFARAGEEFAWEVIQNVRNLIKDSRTQRNKRGVYAPGMANVRKYEPALKSAAVFAGEIADDELIRLWKYAIDLCGQELTRLARKESGERDGRGSGSSRSSRGGQLALQRTMNDINEAREKVLKAQATYYERWMSYGFRIEDPDIQALREKQAFANPDIEP